jgi:hypothetical protein
MGHDEGLWVDQLMVNQEGKKIYSKGEDGRYTQLKILHKLK